MLHENLITPVDRTALIHATEPHPFQIETALQARLNWQAEVRAQPALFDGSVILASTAAVADGVFRAAVHLVPYSTFLYWRRIRPVPGAIHVFAMALIVSSDDALIAVRMGRKTANAGRIYCASGSFDEDDLVGDRFDVDANMRREVLEETGLDLSAAIAAPAYNVLAIGGTVVLFRIYRFAEKAAVLADAVARHVRADPDPEISSAVVVRRPADVTAEFNFHMPPIVDWYFRTGRRQIDTLAP